MDRIRAAQGQATEEPATSVTGEASVEAAPAEAKPRQVWGRPGRCPECNGRGYLDHIDLVDRIMYQHCPECRHQWTVVEAETVSA